MDVPSCVICLENSEFNKPLLLLACGCRGSWFHEPCEYEWLSFQREFPYACPTCRRTIPMLTNYSFSYLAGEDQQYLYHTLIIHIVYSLYFMVATFLHYRHLYVFAFQGGAILTFPFVVSSWNDMSYYLYHTRIHFILTSLIYSLSFFESPEKREGIYSISLLFGYIHLAILYLLHFQEVYNRPNYLLRRDPFAPYAISCELIHSELVTKTPADSREGNKATGGRRKSRR